MLIVLIKIIVAILMAGLLYAFCNLAKEGSNAASGIKYHKRGEKDPVHTQLKKVYKIMSWMPTLTLLVGIPTNIYEFHLYTCSSAHLSDTLVRQFPTQYGVEPRIFTTSSYK